MQQSMPRLHLLEPVDAAVSTLDSLNYLTRERDIRETFRRVFRYLKPGGSFIFDVNTPYKLRRMDCQLYTDETEESYCVWRTFFSEKTKVCTYQVDLFRLRDDGAWERDYEEHRERAWSAEELTALSDGRRALRSITITGDLTRASRPKDTEDRWIVRCRQSQGRKKQPGPAGALQENNMSDQLVRAISKDGFVKAAAVSTRELTERARQIHHDVPGGHGGAGPSAGGGLHDGQ